MARQRGSTLVHPPEVRKLSVSLYESGLSARVVARWMRGEHGIAITPQTVSRWVRELGKSRPVGGPRILVSGEESRALYESGLSLDQVAVRLRVGPTTVAKRLRELGVVIRPSGSRFLHTLTKERLRVLYVREGRTMRNIADEVGCSIATVYRLVRAYGVRRGRRGPRRQA